MSGAVTGLLLVAGLAVLGAACSGEPTAHAPVPEVSPAAPPSGHTVVTGTATPGSVVLLEPVGPPQSTPPVETALMDQFGMAFVPTFLTVHPGQAVEFRNSEGEGHNIRVNDRLTKDMLFNVAPPLGAKYTHTFEEPGYYDVSCDAHGGMFATILVTASPHVLVIGHEGTFTFPDVAPGSYRLIVSSGDERVERAVAVSGDRIQLVAGADEP